MKVIILHGEDINKSYARLTKFLEEAKKRGWEIIEDEIVLTPSLFGKERFLLFRKYQLLTKDKIKSLISLEGTLVIYHEGDIPQTFIKTLPNDTKIEKFDLPKLIWQFLDTFSLKLLHELIESEPVEFVFSLFSKRVRDLYWIKVEPNSLPYQPWQVSRLKKQSEKYTEANLKHVIDKLAEIDVEVKTSKAELLPSLDLLIIKHLE